MDNPWKHIELESYENHMKLNSVMQLQAMNDAMKDQFYRYAAQTVMILGVAGGNGLEHLAPDSFSRVYGVDINASYLAQSVQRYPAIRGCYVPIEADLQSADLLPKADLIIANLIVEYIGYAAFLRVVRKVNPRYVSCMVQINSDCGFVSDSPYIHAFDRLEEVHHPIDKSGLNKSMEGIRYTLILLSKRAMPNGKGLIRLDYQRAFDEQGDKDSD